MVRSVSVASCVRTRLWTSVTSRVTSSLTRERNRIHATTVNSLSDRNSCYVGTSTFTTYLATCHRHHSRRFVSQILLSLSLSLSFPVGGTCHRPNRLQEAHHASWVGRVDVVDGGACLHVSRTAQEQMLCCLVVASAVWT